jgi:hypothetical protein
MNKQPDQRPLRKRAASIKLILVVIALGLPTRLIPQLLPRFCVDYAGDALWALMIFLLLGLVFPAASTRRLVIVALIITWGIEFSELYQADWINAIRSTRIGGLILGFTFLWSDLVSYTIGITAGALLERYGRLKSP